MLDLGLPGMNGLPPVRKLKTNPETHAIPIIALTFYPERFTKCDALAAGCEAYLVKPLDTRKLPVLIDAVAQNRSLTKAETMGSRKIP